MRHFRLTAMLASVTLSLALLVTALPVMTTGQEAPVLPVDDVGAAQEIIVGGERYSRDLDVPVDLSVMEQSTDDNGGSVFIKPGGSDPLGAVYRPLDDGSGLSTRYLPQRAGAADATCPVDQSNQGTLSGDGVTYVAAGPEPDYTADALEQAGATGDGATIYRIPGDESMTNLFVAPNGGQGPNSLIRYVLLDESGAPATLADGFTFAGQEMSLAPGVIGSLDGLVKIGCASLFPLFAPTADQPFTTVAVGVAGQAVSFEGGEVQEPVATAPELPATPEPTQDVGTPVPTEDPSIPVQTTVATPEPTVDVTPAPTVEPTAEPTAEPTVEPTVEPTIEPTAEPTIEPTAEPTAEPTIEPTTEPTVEPTTEPTVEPTTEPTAEPTAEPTVEATAEPTAAPTEDAAAAPTSEPTVAQTEAPTAEPTAEPTVQPTTAPDADLGEEPAALPTEAPPTPGPNTPEPTPPTPRPTPTPRVLQPAAVVPTLPPDVPSPAAGQSDVISCTGNPGEVDSSGIPERLPRNLQYGGTAYRYSGQVSSTDAGDLTATGCVGPFVLYLPAEGGDSNRIYLGLVGSTEALFSFEETSSLSVRTQSPADQQPRSLELGPVEDQPAVRYRAEDPWQRSIYSSLSLEIYVEDPEGGLPSRFMGYSVGFDAFGEYTLVDEGEGASQEVIDKADALGIHQEVVIEGQRYVLVALWMPFGTTTNGWLTLYGIDGEPSPQRLVGLDPRRLDLLVFNASQ